MKATALPIQMPLRFALCLATAVVLSSGLGHAGEGKPRKSSTTAAPAKSAKSEKLIVTGSHIPQKVDRFGRIPTTASPMVIISYEEIGRSGRTTAGGLLIRHPSFR